jgi:hypothetical protein
MKSSSPYINGVNTARGTASTRPAGQDRPDGHLHRQRQRLRQANMLQGAEEAAPWCATSATSTTRSTPPSCARTGSWEEVKPQVHKVYRTGKRRQRRLPDPAVRRPPGEPRQRHRPPELAHHGRLVRQPGAGRNDETFVILNAVKDLSHYDYHNECVRRRAPSHSLGMTNIGHPERSEGSFALRLS